MIETIIMILILAGYGLALMVNRSNNAVRKEILTKTVDKIESHDKDLEKLNSAMWDLRSDVGLLDRRLAAVDYGLKTLTPMPIEVGRCYRCDNPFTNLRECPKSPEGLPCCEGYDLDREDP